MTVVPSHLPSFLRRQESSRRPSAADGAQPPSPLIPRRHVIPAKAGTYWRHVIHVKAGTYPSAPRKCSHAVIPAKAGTYPSASRKCSHAVIPAKAGTYWRHVIPAKAGTYPPQRPPLPSFPPTRE